MVPRGQGLELAHVRGFLVNGNFAVIPSNPVHSDRPGMVVMLQVLRGFNTEAEVVGEEDSQAERPAVKKPRLVMGQEDFERLRGCYEGEGYRTFFIFWVSCFLESRGGRLAEVGVYSLPTQR